MIDLRKACMNRYTSIQSQQRVLFELNRLAKLLQLKSLESIDWRTFYRAKVVTLLNLPELKNRKASTQNFTLNVIKRLCEEAWHAQLISEKQFSAIAQIPRFRGEYKYLPTCLTNNEMKKILNVCSAENTVKGVRDAAIIAIGLGCGLRRTEIAELEISNIDLDNHLLRVCGKGNKERIVGLNGTVQDYLDHWLRLRGGSGSAYCFTPIGKRSIILTSRHLNDETIYLIVQSRSLKAIGRAVSTHDLRRTFASHMLDKHVDLNTLRLLLGHSDIRTTQIYDRRDELARIISAGKISVLPTN